MAFDVFISYSRKDSKIADEICEALSKAGLTFFIDKEGIEAGQNFPQVLADAVDSSTVFLFLASQNSFKSKFTRGEVTYAFNHKRSGTIIPYIIDGSETMPPDLELILGNFNWRRKELCPPQTGLIDDIRKCISHPEEGTVGGRHMMSPHKKKVLVGTAAIVISILTITSLFLALSRGRDRHKNDEALAASNVFESYIKQSDSLILQADVLKDSVRSLETTEEQISNLQAACRLLDRADSLRQNYEDSPFKSFFGKDTDKNRILAQNRLDSIATAWTEYARDSYSLYQISNRDTERENVLSCIGFVLSIRPDQELEKIKDKLKR